MANPQAVLSRVVGAIDGWQRRRPIPSVSYGVVK